MDAVKKRVTVSVRSCKDNTKHPERARIKCFMSVHFYFEVVYQSSSAGLIKISFQNANGLILSYFAVKYKKKIPEMDGCVTFTENNSLQV